MTDIHDQKDAQGNTASTKSHDRSTAENDNSDSGMPVKKRVPFIFILIIVFIAIGLIAYLKSQKIPVRQSPPPPPKPTVDYATLIQVNADQASRRNSNALKKFKMDINRILKRHKTKLSSAARKGATETASYWSCCKIIYYLALDKVKRQNKTKAYLNRKIKPFIEPAIQALGANVNAATTKLDYELRRSTVQLARDLAALLPSNANQKLTINVNFMSRLDIQQALLNLGFNAMVNAVSIPFDVVMLIKSRIIAVFWKKIRSVATRMFAKQVAKVAASTTFAVADGPLPIGDIIGIVGIIWTGYDIYTSQKEFKREINTSLDSLLANVSHSVHKQAIQHASAIMKNYQKLQDKIGTQTLNHIVKENN